MNIFHHKGEITDAEQQIRHAYGDPDCPRCGLPKHSLDGLLTPAEHKALGLTAELWNLFVQEIVGNGETRIQDSSEFASHIHDIQHTIMAQAAARAYPDQLRLLGSMGLEAPVLDWD